MAEVLIALGAVHAGVLAWFVATPKGETDPGWAWATPAPPPPATDEYPDQYEVPPNQPPAEAAPPPPKVYDGPQVANSYRAQDVTYDSRIVV